MRETDNKLNEAVIEATKEMFQSLMGSEIELKGVRQGRADISHYDINVIIGFAGDESGVFILQCPKKLGLDAASKMLGVEITEDSEEMRDAIAELMNMIVGKAKSVYSAEVETFKMSIPTTIVGNNYVVHTKALDYKKESSIDFGYNGYDFIINVLIK